MNLAELKTITTRLTIGPVPTTEKKVYIFIGPLKELQEALPRKSVINASVLDAFVGSDLPEQEEEFRGLIEQQLSSYIEKLRKDKKTSVLILRDAVLLARYRVALTFLYNLVGDAHAIVLHCNRAATDKGWKPPTYINFSPDEVTRFFEVALGNQCIQSNATGI